jgi:hypothetical protein
MNLSKENYTKVIIEDLINSQNQFKTAIILLREESTGLIFPVGLENSFFEYLKNISDDKNHEEKFLCDIVYKLDSPKEIFIDLKYNKLTSFYINKNDKSVYLNLIEILSFAIRYSIDIYVQNKLIHPEIGDDYFINADLVNHRKIDLYRLDKIQLDNSKH